MKSKFILAFCAILGFGSIFCELRAEEIKQPVFLLCPLRERFGSWSLSMVVDSSDPSKPLKMVLEELAGKNAKDDTYTKVLEAQRDAKSERVALGTLEAASFASGSLRVAKDNALNVTVTPDGENYKLMVDMRISADGHFVIGGADAEKRSVILKFNKGLKAWVAYATTLADTKGQNIVTADPVMITGLVFPVSATGIYRIEAVLAGGYAVRVFDK